MGLFDLLHDHSMVESRLCKCGLIIERVKLDDGEWGEWWHADSVLADLRHAPEPAGGLKAWLWWVFYGFNE